MKPGRILAAGGVLLAACLLATACGGGKDEGKKDDIPLLLQGMVLTSADLPQGLQQASASFSTNKDVADASLDSEATLAKLEARGRQLGYDVQFEPGADAPAALVVKGMQNTASLYKTVAGASEALAEGVNGARSADRKTIYPDESDVKVDELTLPSGADEGTWFRISGVDASGNLIIDDQVAFRVDAVRSFVRVLTAFAGGQDRNGYRDEVARWVSVVAKRIKDALQH